MDADPRPRRQIPNVARPGARRGDPRVQRGRHPLVVRPYCHNDHYWQVYFDTNKALAEVGAANGWPIPAPHQVLRQPS
jgi:small conductance mechanosensitive channel